MEIRLNRFLSDAGVCSRREADRLTEAGRITVDAKPAVLGQKVTGCEQIAVDGRPVLIQEKKVILAVNKPVGVVCTTSQKDRAPAIVELIRYPLRVYPVGRLDKNSQGLLLLTNDGALTDALLRARNGHEKEYIVEVDRPVTKEFLQKMARGVPILETVTRPCQTEWLGPKRFRIVLTQGLNRQIRRMCEYLGFRVVRLERVRIVNIRLGDLAPGAFRELEPKEEQELRRRLQPDMKQGSRRTPAQEI